MAVPGCARGIIAQTAEQPELVVAVDPVRTVAAAAGSIKFEGLIWEQLVAIYAVLGTGVRALDPGPSPWLACGGVRSVDPQIV
jgi:hypothetical protein